jgi:hypothetical protein
MQLVGHLLGLPGGCVYIYHPPTLAVRQPRRTSFQSGILRRHACADLKVQPRSPIPLVAGSTLFRTHGSCPSQRTQQEKKLASISIPSVSNSSRHLPFLTMSRRRRTVKTTSVKSSARLETMPVLIMEFSETMWTAAVITVKEERRPINNDRRIKTSPERTVVDPVSRNKRVGKKIRNPVPSGADPSRPVPTGTRANIDARSSYACFR